MYLHIEDNRTYHRKWYLKNKERRIKLIRVRNAALKAWFKELKSKLFCVHCGENHPATLDFHHRDRKMKLLGVSLMVRDGRSKENIMKEIDKCDVLCSNCHRKEHARLA